MQIVDTLTKYNIAFRSLTENFETETPMGKFALQMMGAVGELERNTIVENVKMGHRQRAKTGKHNGKVALGFVTKVISNKSARRKETILEINHNEALIVKKIFEWYASGRGYKSIANQLNHEGYRTKPGNPFSICAVKDILLNPIYNGKIRYNRFENWSDKRRKGKCSDPIFVNGEHKAIVTDDL